MKHWVLVLGVVMATSATAQTIIPSMQREGAEHARKADAFFASLHVVPPGLQWRLVNQAVRDARADERARMRMEHRMPHAARWTEVGSVDQAGRVVAVDVDTVDGRCWVAGAGGTIWEGDVDGGYWQCLNDEQRIEDPKLLVHARMGGASERLVVVSGSPRCWYRDGDGAWQQAEGLADMQRWGWFDYATRIVRNGRLEIIASGVEWDYGTDWRAKGVLYRSIDTGRTYERLGWFEGRRTLWSDGRSDVLYWHNDTVKRVLADGSISGIGTGLPWTITNDDRVMVCGVRGDLMAAAITGNNATMYHSADGVTWRMRGSVDFGPFALRSLGCTIAEPRAWFYGGVNVVRSVDTGATWSLVNQWYEYYGDPQTKLHADIPGFWSFTMRDGREITMICTDGGLYRSFDGLATVDNISRHGLNVSQYYSIYTNRDNVQIVSAGSQDQGFQRSSVAMDEPRPFVQLLSGDYAQIVSSDGGKSLFTVYPGFTMYVPNAEDGWGPISLGFPHRNHHWLPPLAIEQGAVGEVWLGGGTRDKGAKLYRYRASTGALVIDSVDYDFGLGEEDVRISCVGIAPSDGRHRYVVTTTGNVFASHDGGITWTRTVRPDGMSGHYLSGNAIVIDPRDPITWYLGGSGYQRSGVSVTTDGGETFTSLEGLAPCLVLDLDLSADGTMLYAATDVGAYAYDLQSKTWTDLNLEGGPDQVYWSVDFVPQLNIARFGTYGRGIWDYAHGTPSNVDADPDTRDFRLDVRATLGTDGVRLAIRNADPAQCQYRWYDLQGRLLSTDARIPDGAVMVIVTHGQRVGAAVIPR